MSTEVFHIEGLDCAEEVRLLKGALLPLVGDEDRLQFDLLRGKLSVDTTDLVLSPDQLVSSIGGTGLRAVPWEDTPKEPVRRAWPHPRTMLCMASGVLLLAAAGLQLAQGGLHGLILGKVYGNETMVLLALATALGTLPFLPKAWYALRALRPDMNLLMVTAVCGAVLLFEWREAAMVAFLFSLALMLEAWSVARARNAIGELMDLAPQMARVVGCGCGSEKEVPVDDVAVGATVRIRPGERVPLDGEVLEGVSSVNQAPITGESTPVGKREGDTVFAGSINNEGLLSIRTTRPASDSSLARIIRLVESAQAHRAPVEQWIGTFARYYTPVMMLLALLVAVVPPLAMGVAWGASFYLALVMLLIACPCALVISTPVSIVAGISSAARAGVLIKGGAYLEAPARLRALAIDKTGTLTAGRPEVQRVVPLDGHNETCVLRAAAAVEAHSNHPIARAIRAHATARGVAFSPANDHTLIDGKGATGVVDGETWWVGSHRLLTERGHDGAAVEQHALDLEDAGHTVVMVGREAAPIGLISVADAPRAAARDAVAALRAAGLHVTMLTGDNEGTARELAAQVGVDGFRAELLPEDKLAAIEELRAAHGPVAMVGDGVNDAPALAAADVAIAMGAAGTDAAIETADIALMSDDLAKLPWLIHHARRTLGIIRQNIVLALGLKFAVLVLALFGWGTLWLAIAADMGASLLVIANALRLLRGRSSA